MQIAVQVALVVAKVARFDFPSQWPGLFNDLLAGLGPAAAAAAAAAAAGSGSSSGGAAAAGPSMLVVRRTYFVLHHVLKELSSKRLAADQKAFAEVGLQETQKNRSSSSEMPRAWLQCGAMPVVTGACFLLAELFLQETQNISCQQQPPAVSTECSACADSVWQFSCRRSGVLCIQRACILFCRAVVRLVNQMPPAAVHTCCWSTKHQVTQLLFDHV
jgi:hypothetical protein